MALHNDFGKLGEEKAVAYLKKEGYTILERNWRLGHLEIDIICTDGELLIIVEVKSRRRAEDRPDELLDFRKKRHLLQAGEAYLRYKGWEKELRFDLILVTGEKLDIQHIPDAIQIFD